MPIAFSYLRFSSPQQSTGDSLRRQTESRERWLAAHPKVRLDQSLSMTDAGRSAFKRADWATYALKAFVDQIEAGRIAPGSYLLVENLDRLSRDHAGDAVELFLRIVNQGIIVVQLSPVVIEFKRPVQAMELMMATMELSRGHSESAIKSERGRASWARKQKEASTRLVTRKLPGWIKATADGKLILDSAGAKAVRRIFNLAMAGHGSATIAQKLNDEGVPVLGRTVMRIRGQADTMPQERRTRPVHWSTAVVWYILTSRATIGEYLPYASRGTSAAKPVANYFPPVVDEETFAAVAGAIARRSKIGRGRRGTHVNIFSGLLRDARTGGTLSYWHTGLTPPTLIPVDVKEGKKKGQWVSFPAHAFDEAIISKLVELKSSDIADQRSDKARKVDSVAGRLAQVDKGLEAWTAKMDNIDIVEIVAAKLAELNTQRKKLADELAEAQRDAASSLADTWSEFRKLVGNSKNLTDDDRLRIRSALRRCVEEVVCLFVKRASYSFAAATVYFNGGATRNYLIIHRRGTGGAVGKRPSLTWCMSIKHPDDQLPLNEWDLRDPTDVESLEIFLEAYPLLMADCVLNGVPLSTLAKSKAKTKIVRRKPVSEKA